MKLAVVCLLIFSSLFTYADWSKEKPKVEYLISAVGSMKEAVFIRNGKEYSPKKAAEHLRFKLKNAQNSWFSPSKEKWTAMMFIEKIASKSSFSGKPYQIKVLKKDPVTSEKWLKAKLKLFDK